MLALIFGIPPEVTPQSNLEATPQSEDIPQAGVQLPFWLGSRQFLEKSVDQSLFLLQGVIKDEAVCFCCVCDGQVGKPRCMASWVHSCATSVELSDRSSW